MGAEKRRKIQQAKDGTRKGGRPSTGEGNVFRIDYPDPFPMTFFSLLKPIREPEFRRTETLEEELGRKMLQRARLNGSLYRLLGLQYDENGQGYWTRGLQRLREAGIAIPIPPRRFALPVIHVGET